MNRRSLLQTLGLSLGTLTLPHLGRANTTPTPEKPFRIAHITDVHMMPLIGAAKGFSKCLDHIQSLPHKPDLIINSGDAIMDAHRGGRAIAEKQWRTWNNVIEKYQKMHMEYDPDNSLLRNLLENLLLAG